MYIFTGKCALGHLQYVRLSLTPVVEALQHEVRRDIVETVVRKVRLHSTTVAAMHGNVKVGGWLFGMEDKKKLLFFHAG